MREKPVEEHLKDVLEGTGFKVLKLQTPGYNGVMDRMILRPKWSPGPPFFVECKRPKAKLRRLQELVRDEMKSRGCRVLELCDNYKRVDEVFLELMDICQRESL